MGDKRDVDLASAFSIPVEIVPFIPELLADLWALGVPPGLIVELLRPLDLPPRSTRVLDLGCGKGAVSITLARELGFNVDGIDIFPPFLEDAEKRAADLYLNEICRFREGDIREIVNKGGDYDVATLIWVGGALGDPGESVEKLRRMVRSRGYMVYAEGYLKDRFKAGESHADAIHGGRLSHEEILRKITTHGDIIVRETVVPEDQTRSLYVDYIDSLRNGTARITRDHPELETALKEHITSQEQMCRMLEEAVVPAVWLLRKN